MHPNYTAQNWRQGLWLASFISLRYEDAVFREVARRCNCRYQCCRNRTGSYPCSTARNIARNKFRGGHRCNWRVACNTARNVASWIRILTVKIASQSYSPAVHIYWSWRWGKLVSAEHFSIGPYLQDSFHQRDGLPSPWRSVQKVGGWATLTADYTHHCGSLALIQSWIIQKAVCWGISCDNDAVIRATDAYYFFQKHAK